MAANGPKTDCQVSAGTQQDVVRRRHRFAPVAGTPTRWNRRSAWGRSTTPATTTDAGGNPARPISMLSPGATCRFAAVCWATSTPESAPARVRNLGREQRSVAGRKAHNHPRTCGLGAAACRRRQPAGRPELNGGLRRRALGRPDQPVDGRDVATWLQLNLPVDPDTPHRTVGHGRPGVGEERTERGEQRHGDRDSGGGAGDPAGLVAQQPADPQPDHPRCSRSVRRIRRLGDPAVAHGPAAGQAAGDGGSWVAITKPAPPLVRGLE